MDKQLCKIQLVISLKKKKSDQFPLLAAAAAVTLVVSDSV